MADNHIIYDRTKPLGQMTAELAGEINDVLYKVNRLMAVANQMGAGSDATVLEVGNADGLAMFGVAAGKGAAFYTALNYMYNGLNAIAKDQLSNLDLGS